MQKQKNRSQAPGAESSKGTDRTIIIHDCVLSDVTFIWINRLIKDHVKPHEMQNAYLKLLIYSIDQRPEKIPFIDQKDKEDLFFLWRLLEGLNLKGI